MTDSSSEQAVLEGVPTELYIGGRWRAASGSGTLPVEDPSTGETLIEVADAQPADALDALSERRRAPGRVGRPPSARARGDPAPRL